MLISRLVIPVIEILSVDLVEIAAERVVVIPAYSAICLPARFSLSTETLPPADAYPNLYAYIVPSASGAVVPTPTLTLNEV